MRTAKYFICVLYKMHVKLLVMIVALHYLPKETYGCVADAYGGPNGPPLSLLFGDLATDF